MNAPTISADQARLACLLLMSDRQSPLYAHLSSETLAAHVERKELSRLAFEKEVQKYPRIPTDFRQVELSVMSQYKKE